MRDKGHLSFDLLALSKNGEHVSLFCFFGSSKNEHQFDTGICVNSFAGNEP